MSTKTCQGLPKGRIACTGRWCGLHAVDRGKAHRQPEDEENRYSWLDFEDEKDAEEYQDFDEFEEEEMEELLEDEDSFEDEVDEAEDEELDGEE